MTPRRIHVSSDPRERVLAQMDFALGIHMAAEQAHRNMGEYQLAEEDHRRGLIVLRARMAEDDDPAPKEWRR